MGLDATVVVATYGSTEWLNLARVAARSADHQAPVIRSHGRNLADARNAGLAEVRSEFTVFLDADDELEDGYIEALGHADADMCAPAVRYVRNGREARPRIPRVAGHRHACSADCLPEGNWLVIGTAVRTDLALQVGGFQYEELYEDWSFFLRCYLAGGTVEAVPDAVYRANVNDDSRNRAPARQVKEAWHHRIYDACFPRQPLAA